MESLVNFFRQRLANPLNLGQFIHASGLNAFQATETSQQFLPPFRPHTVDVLQRRMQACLAALIGAAASGPPGPTGRKGRPFPFRSYTAEDYARHESWSVGVFHRAPSRTPSAMPASPMDGIFEERNLEGDDEAPT